MEHNGLDDWKDLVAHLDWTLNGSHAQFVEKLLGLTPKLNDLGRCCIERQFIRKLVFYAGQEGIHEARIPHAKEFSLLNGQTNHSWVPSVTLASSA